MTEASQLAPTRSSRRTPSGAQLLTPEQYYVTRQHGTERAGTSPLNREKRAGMFACVVLRRSAVRLRAKFNSGTGWPSFDKPADAEAVSEHEDRALFMRRTEVRCARCEAHLGHVFPDGPRATRASATASTAPRSKFKPGGT